MTVGPVIAISGFSGSGKTTLSLAVRERLGCAVVAYDAYETITSKPVAVIMDWIARGQNYDEVKAPGLVEAVTTARAKGPVIFDMPVGRAFPATRDLIDVSVWIDCPTDLALARKIGQMADAQDPIPFTAWLRGYLDAYQTLIMPTLAVQESRTRPCADFELSAEQPIDQMVKQLLAKCDLP